MVINLFVRMIVINFIISYQIDCFQVEGVNLSYLSLDYF